MRQIICDHCGKEIFREEDFAYIGVFGVEPKLSRKYLVPEKKDIYFHNRKAEVFAEVHKECALNLMKIAFIATEADDEERNTHNLDE